MVAVHPVRNRLLELVWGEVLRIIGEEVVVMGGTRIGEVTHYFGNINVAVISLTDSIQIGDMLHFLGRTTDFRQVVKSLQIEHDQVERVGEGQEVAMEVIRRVRPRDKVFKLTGDN
jgi:hypothetical protein